MAVHTELTPSEADWTQPRLPNEQEVLAIAEKWRPFRSLATSYLFASAFDRDDVDA